LRRCARGASATYSADVQSRFDAATLEADAIASSASRGWLSGLLLSLTLRSAMRLVAVFA
jgi:hypothetical protein